MLVGLLAVVRFESAQYLALLAVLPLLVVFSIRSLAGLGPIRRVLDRGPGVGAVGGA